MKRALTIAAAVWMGSAWACTDFTGNWKGTCQEQGVTESFSDETKIQQTGCSAITVDGVALTIGQATTATQTEQGVTQTLERLPEWNANQSVLVETDQIKGVEQSSGRTLFEVTSKNTLTLDGQQLISQVNETSRDLGSTPPQTSTRSVRCVFTKQ